MKNCASFDIKIIPLPFFFPEFEQSLVTGPEKRKPAVLMLSVLKKIPGVEFQRIFGYVILQKILLLMIPKLALYDFFPGRTHYLSSTAILMVRTALASIPLMQLTTLATGIIYDEKVHN